MPSASISSSAGASAPGLTTAAATTRPTPCAEQSPSPYGTGSAAAWLPTARSCAAEDAEGVIDPTAELPSSASRRRLVSPDGRTHTGLGRSEAARGRNVQASTPVFEWTALHLEVEVEAEKENGSYCAKNAEAVKSQGFGPSGWCLGPMIRSGVEGVGRVFVR